MSKMETFLKLGTILLYTPQRLPKMNSVQKQQVFLSNISFFNVPCTITVSIDLEPIQGVLLKRAYITSEKRGRKKTNACTNQQALCLL